MNCIFYHIVIETINNETLYELDLTDPEQLSAEIILPYINGEKFLFDGHTLSENGVRSIHVKITMDRINNLIKAKEKDSLQYGIYYNHKDILDNPDLTQDITRKMIPALYAKRIQSSNPNSANKISYSKVFIVHGHDELAKTEVARFIEKLGLEAIILSEQPNEGKTIIEKIEDYADVGFAIILYTPCDEGKAIGSPDLKQRARQNVVFEHGFFIGRLGRNHVHALKKGDIELPNDISGVVYTPMDEAKAWRFEIAKEMREAGYNIDLNKL